MRGIFLKFLPVIIIYLLLINFIAYVMYGIDKNRSKAGINPETGYSNKRRISEANLIGLALLGGTVGAFLAMRVFRHKTRHAKFVIGVPFIFILHCILFIFIMCH